MNGVWYCADCAAERPVEEWPSPCACGGRAIYSDETHRMSEEQYRNPPDFSSVLRHPKNKGGGIAMATMAIMDPSAGDLKVVWDPGNKAEVKAAKDQFDALIKKGQHLAYKVDAKGGKGEQIREFDPKAEKIILAPALRGG